MLVHVVIMVARQIEGEYIAVRTIGGSTDKQKAEALRDKVKQECADANGKVKVIHLKTPNGEMDCICEVGAFEVEIEDPNGRASNSTQSA